MTSSSPREIIARLYETNTHAPRATEAADYGGWVKAWRKSAGGTFVSFLADELVKADPSPRGEHLATLFQWLCYGMSYDDLPEARRVLETISTELAEGKSIIIERYAVVPLVSKPRERKFRPGPTNLLRNRKSLRDVADFLERRVDRQVFLLQSAQRQERDQKYLLSGEALLYSNTPDFRLYGIKTSAACSAYTGGSAYGCWGYNKDGDENLLLHLELGNGARYQINPENLRIDANFMLGSFDVDLRRMLHDIPGLIDCLSAAIKDYLAMTGSSEINDRALPGFALVGAGLLNQSPAEPGVLAQNFMRQYRHAIEARGTSRDKAAHVSRNFYNVSKDVLTIASLPGERAQVSGDFMRQIFAATIGENCLGEAQKMLTMLPGVAAWREVLTADDVFPLFAALAADRSQNKKLAYLFGLAAKNRNWCDGREATYLLLTIDMILKKKDWAKLKTILSFATRPDDPVAIMWRQAIPVETSDAIRIHRFDNSYKHHFIDVLLHRLDRLDAGDYQPFRLRETPMGDIGLAQQQQYIQALRCHRALQKTGFAARAG